uniref:Immunoglobulin superfamily member 10 n=1 Tax=Gopherus evgoodei TaxID=1825980 RepID=A0A8C4W7S8_9SAUR
MPSSLVKSKVITVHSGKPVSVKCRAEGRPIPTISWILANKTYVSESFPGSKQASVQPDGTLIIKEVTVYDRGLYTCMASNPAGADTLTVKLQVIVAPPVILEEKRQHIAGIMGESLKLPCTAKGNPHPSVHWVLFDGTVVKPLHFVNAKLFLFSNGTLYIRNIAPSDSGNYECIATSSTGSERRVVNLTVEQRDTIPRILIILEVGQKPTILTRSRGPIKSISGESLSLHCLADGSPKPNIIWTISGKYILLENGTLVIREATIHDRGNYLCKAQNNAGESSITVPVMTVAYPPRITNRPPQSVRTMAGAAVQLNCMALGIPKPEITWELPDHSVLSPASKGRPSGSELLHPQGTLIIQNPKSSDSGMYKCTAKNQFGSDFTITYIQVV